MRNRGIISILSAFSIVFLANIMTVQSQPDSALVSSESQFTGVLRSIHDRAGVTIGGEFRSQYVNSRISGSASSEARRSGENIAFTSVDLDLAAQPHRSARGRVILRLHQDWRNLFVSAENAVFVRWVGMDGRAGDFFRYDLGDFKKKYTPLTLYTPELDLLYEPGIFRLDRDVAMNEEWLGDNSRLFQGAQLSFLARLRPVFDTLQVDAFGSRLRVPFVKYNNMFSALESSDRQSFATGGRVAGTLVKGISLAGIGLKIFDLSSSMPRDDTLVGENRTILSATGNVDVQRLLGLESFGASVGGEAAVSIDNPFIVAAPGESPEKPSGSDGSALRADLKLGYNGRKNGLFSAQMNVSLLRNSSGYVNELAQSPSFLGRRILNWENDGEWNSANPHDKTAQYSTFDAMYHSVFAFNGEAGQLALNSPIAKNSYTNGVFTDDELRRIDSTAIDPAVQLVFPYGPATPNRAGLDMNFVAKFIDGKLEAVLLYTALQEDSPIRKQEMILPLASFGRLGAGAKLQVGGLIGAAYPMTVYGSLVRSQMERDEVDSTVTSRVVSDFANAGLDFQFWRRTALLFGYQYIRTSGNAPGTDWHTTEHHTSGGVEYRIGDSSYLQAKLTRIANAKMRESSAGRIASGVIQSVPQIQLMVRF